MNVRTANLVYFDNTKHDIGPEHIMASGSLPPGLPATEIEANIIGMAASFPTRRWNWCSRARRARIRLPFKSIWNASGRLPGSLIEADERQRDIRFSSRTRAAINQFKRVQLWRRATHHLLERLPEELRQLPQANLLAGEADEKVYNILIYHTKNYEGVSQDYEFSRRTMEEHWQSGYNDAVRTLRHPGVLQRPENHEGVFTFDLARDGRE